ncbi:hypothetical protein CR513_05046, partial [Mucuna pruriens]
MDCEVLESLYKCIDRLSENDEFVDHIHNEFPLYKRVRNSGRIGWRCEDTKDELIFDNDVLTWRDVASAIRASEPLKHTIRQTQMKMAATASTSRKEKGKRMVEEKNEDESVKMKGRKSIILVLMGMMKTMTWNYKRMKKIT